MDKNGSCRILTNPKNLSIYKNKDNAVINPDIKWMIQKGVKPYRWIVKDGKLDYSILGKRTNVASIDESTYVLSEVKSEVRSILFHAGLMAVIIIGMAIATK